jgi:response regulator RpfG family c-di-GMP phosphodiesterase
MNENAEKSRLLVVDDESGMLSALKRLFIRGPYVIDTCENAKSAMELLTKQIYDVVISDMRMPEIDGAQLLAHVAEQHPLTRRILLTGYSDQEATVRAINEGHIHRYFAKPWDSGELRETVEKLALERRTELKKIAISSKLKSVNENLQKVAMTLEQQCASAHAELEQVTSMYDMAKEELFQTYETTIKAFTHVINLRLKTSPVMSQVVEDDAVGFCNFLGLDRSVCGEIRHAALLYQLGKIGFDDSIIATPCSKWTRAQQDAYRRYPATGADALAALDAMNYTAKIIRHHMEDFAGTGYPFGLANQDIPLGSRILRIIIDYHTHRSSNKPARGPMSDFDHLKVGSGKVYDPELVQAFLVYRASRAASTDDGCAAIATSQLKPDIINGRDLFNRDGLLLLAKGSRFTPLLIEKLRQYEQLHKIKLTIYIKDAANA